MKRFLTFAILFHWMMFFALHAVMALAGAPVFGILRPAGGPAALPMVEAGMGIVCIFAAVLFSWALLSALARRQTGQAPELDLERTAFASSAFVFSCLSLIAITRSDESALLSASAYFAALLVSWAAASVEWELLSARALKLAETEGSRHARIRAGASRLAGRAFPHFGTKGNQVMRYILLFWAAPLGLFWGWYFLSLNDISMGTQFFSRKLHDLVFMIYGNILGIEPDLIPAMVAKACLVDTLLIAAIYAFRKRKAIAQWARRLRPADADAASAAEIA